MNALANLCPEMDKKNVQGFGTKITDKHIKNAILFNFPNNNGERRLGPIDRRLIKTRTGGRRKTDKNNLIETLPEDILSLLEKYPGSEFKFGNPNNQCIEIKTNPNSPGVYRIYGTIEEIRGSIQYVLDIIEKKVDPTSIYL